MWDFYCADQGEEESIPSFATWVEGPLSQIQDKFPDKLTHLGGTETSQGLPVPWVQKEYLGQCQILFCQSSCRLHAFPRGMP